jgi:DNA-binding MarR family transcriptional regulator
LEQIQHKIITFLTRNAHLDVEVPDIAFHLKLDEKIVKSNLDALLEMDIVSMKQNQYGRTYWYYVPQRSTMPFETMITKVPEELSESIETESEIVKSSSRFALASFIISLVSVIMLIVCSVWFYTQLNGKIAQTHEEFKGYVTKEELTAVVETTEARIVKVETELKKTIARADSLKYLLLEIKSAENPSRPVLSQKSTRRKATAATR